MRTDLKHFNRSLKSLHGIALGFKRVHPPLKRRRVLLELSLGNALVSHQRLQHGLLAIKVPSELIFDQTSHLLKPLLEAFPVDSALFRDLLDLGGSVHLKLLQPLEERPACGFELA